MTDFPASDDELLSSFIDGELTVDERARLDARLAEEPPLAARLADLRAAADLAATPVPALAAADRDSVLAAALAASDTSPAVSDLTVERSRRQARWGGRIAAAAAGVLLVAVAVPVLLNQSDGDDDVAGDAAETMLADDEADTLGSTSDDGSGDGDGADDGSLDLNATESAGDMGEDAAEGGDAPTADGDDSVAALDAVSLRLLFGLGEFEDDLGSYATAEELRAQVRDRFDESNANASTFADGEGTVGAAGRSERLTEVGLEDCEGIIAAVEEDLGPIVLQDQTTATVDGVPHAVLLYALADGSIRAVIVEQSSCVVVDSVELRPAG